jgi:CRISPR-associated endonuclease/helicase Cas3
LFFSNSYFSHPGKTLSEHLKSVAENSHSIVESKRLNLTNFISEKVLADVAYIIGASHDFGKFTSYFQKYLLAGEDEKRRLRNKPETRHSFISAIFVLTAVEEYLRKIELLEKEYYSYLPILAFLVVRRHHGDLKDVLDDLSIEEEEIEICRKQIDAINFADAQKIYDSLFAEIIFSFNLNVFKEKIFGPSFWAFELKDKARDLEELNSPFFYVLLLFLYSVLLESDKSNAAELLKIKRQKLSGNLVDIYREKKFDLTSGGINGIRNEIYNEVVSQIGEVNLDKEKIFSLNVPTGSGKTLTSFSFALKLRERIEQEKGYSPKIIYSLPFLSVIEQNYEVIEEVLNYPATDILLKHHHLSEIFYTDSENEYNGNEADIGKALLLIEGWTSEVIVTTFVQFFHSLITNRNRAARKFHNIVNSIVIFDEIQAIPHHYWLLLDSIINFLAENFNTYFIVMTATDPKIFGSAKSLIQNKEKYFSGLNRYLLYIEKQEQSLEDFVKIVKRHLSEERNKDFLIVLNTIKSSIKVFEELKNSVGENDELFYLSTNIVPKARAERIKEIRKPSEKRKIIVSTQMIEAGVDIDVDIIFRDFAPLDSVNQTAGRCNRNFKFEKGEVHLVNIFQENKDSEQKYFPKKIYDSFLISKAEDTITGIKEIEEKDFLPLTEKYFESVSKGMSDNKSEEVIRNVKTLNFSEIAKFTLIEKDYPTVDLFIAIDKDADKIWEKCEQIRNDKNQNSFEKRNENLKIKRVLNNYIISIPKNIAKGFEEGMLNYTSKEMLNAFYDFETGFKRENTGSGVAGF